MPDQTTNNDWSSLGTPSNSQVEFNEHYGIKTDENGFAVSNTTTKTETTSNATTRGKRVEYYSESVEFHGAYEDTKVSNHDYASLVKDQSYMAARFYNTDYNGNDNAYPQLNTIVPVLLPIEVSSQKQPILAPRSLFNDWSVINFRGIFGGYNDPSENGDVSSRYADNGDKIHSNSGFWRNEDPTYANIIKAYEDTVVPYKVNDFLWCKYHNVIPNNQMITLRRFVTPPYDDIIQLNSSLQMPKTINQAGKPPVSGSGYKYIKNYPKKNGDLNEYELSEPNAEEKEAMNTKVTSDDLKSPLIATAVTYFDGDKNVLSDILKFEWGANWKENKAPTDTQPGTDQGYNTSPWYQELSNTKGGSIACATVDAFAPNGGVGRHQWDRNMGAAMRGNISGDWLGAKYGDQTFGPVNVIDSVWNRTTGISFSNDFSLTFDYELKSLFYVNPKIAMLDMISNFLMMSYNDAQFMGSFQRVYGSASSLGPQFGDINKLRHGDFRGYFGSIKDQISQKAKVVFGDNKKIGGTGNPILDLIQTAAGNLLGKFLLQGIGTNGGAIQMKAAISGDPSGYWHVTLGNPLNPIATMGNMILEKTSMQFGNMLGFDDFPTSVEFICQMKHGRARDKTDIENMFSGGIGRIYYPIGTLNDDEAKQYLGGASLKMPNVHAQDIASAKTKIISSSYNNTIQIANH